MAEKGSTAECTSKFVFQREKMFLFDRKDRHSGKFGIKQGV